ncbi:hypothetical protein BKA93DRAFT_808038 [Sparassis latifolia]
MWVLSGPFDGEDADNLSKINLKLLKTGKEYIVGRKDQPLLIRNKKVSHRHAIFIVKECTEDDVMNSAFKPELILEVFGKPRHIQRPGRKEPLTVNPGQRAVLKHDDSVLMVTGVEVKILWENVCCYSPAPRARLPFSLQSCASLGVSMVVTPRAEVTHHLTPTYTLSPLIAISLISAAQFVKPEWLTDLLSLGESINGAPSMLEQKFVLPPVTKYHPAFSPMLPVALRSFHVWQPDEARVGMFRNYRFIFVGEKGREAQEMMRELVKSGEGEYECCSVDGGRRGLHQVLAKGKGKKRALTLVADEDSIVAAVGDDRWQELEEEATSFDLTFIPHEKILEAVVRADASFLVASSKQQASSPLPDAIPNTIQDEPTFPPHLPRSEPQSAPAPAPETGPPRRRLPRRATSRASSRAPSPPSAASDAAEGQTQAMEPPKPRRTLVRRAGRSRAPTIIGIDDPSMILDGDSVAGGPSAGPEEPAPVEPEGPSRTTAATPGRSSRLKRRVGATQMPPSLLGLSEDVAIPGAGEPPLKKFKALFEESDPDRIAQSQLLGSTGEPLDSQYPYEKQSLTQSESGMTQLPGRTRFGGELLMAVAEEEEEDTTTADVRSQMFGKLTRGAKRKNQAEDGVVQMDEPEPKHKRRAIENVNAVEATTSQRGTQKPPSTVAKPPSKPATQAQKIQKTHGRAGAAPGKPDTDQAFLKAVASTKRGKKIEDSFDREFNNLKISKPDLEHDQQQKEWDVLDDFGDDHNLRGNFMLIMEMDVPEHREGRQPLRRGRERMDWEGRPDFKKFMKKVVIGEGRPLIELLVDNKDYGMESQHLEDESQMFSQSRSRSAEQPEGRSSKRSQRSGKFVMQTQGKGKSKATAPAVSDVDSGDEEIPQPRTRKKTQTQTQTQSKKQPLFIESDEEQSQGQAVNDDVFDKGFDDDDEELTLRSSGSRTQTTSKKPSAQARGPRKQTIALDVDSDDGATFKGFGARRR